MSYLGFAKHLCSGYLSKIHNPIILEIGIDRGQTTIPILHNLSLKSKSFKYIGVDIKPNDCFLEQLYNFEGLEWEWCPSEIDLHSDSGSFYFLNENSLSWLKNVQRYNNDKIFDLVLLDGDHNYHTVTKELELLEPLLKPTSLIVCDDYNGRYSTKDLFYSEKQGYSDIKDATKKIVCEKTGVKPAVDDFISNSRFNYKLESIVGEPCLIYRDDIIGLETNFGRGPSWYDANFNFYLKRKF